MRATRRCWITSGLGVFLTVSAVVVARPLLLVGATGISAWLLAKQYTFTHAITRTIDDLAIEHSVPHDSIPAETEMSSRLSAELSSASPLDVRLEIQPPATATGSTREERTLSIEQGAQEASTTVPLTWSVAGSFSFDQPKITVTDTDDLFQERLTHGPTPEVVVEPRAPHDLHIGTGGERSMRVYGQHESVRRAAGLDPGELREYLPGDSAQRIDWKATARMNEPYVREYEVEIDRTIALIFDHRETMHQSSEKGTKLDYARQAALTFVDSVREFSDPIGYYAIGETGPTDRYEPKGGQHELVKYKLRTLRSTASREDTVSAERSSRHPAVVQHAAAKLDGNGAFDSTLYPYFATSSRHDENVDEDPLFETVRTHLMRLRGPVWTAIFTDDSHRSELREAVRAARRGHSHVLVFLTPSTLFEPGGLADLETAYDRYREFEEFRRDLAQLDDVRAFEVGPGDRLDAVLAAGRQRRSGARAASQYTND